MFDKDFTTSEFCDWLDVNAGLVYLRYQVSEDLLVNQFDQVTENKILLDKEKFSDLYAWGDEQKNSFWDDIYLLKIDTNEFLNADDYVGVYCVVNKNSLLKLYDRDKNFSNKIRFDGDHSLFLVSHKYCLLNNIGGETAYLLEFKLKQPYMFNNILGKFRHDAIIPVPKESTQQSKTTKVI